MRKAHIISGLIVFSTGFFLTYYYSARVVEFFKGAIQPVTIILGLIALASALLGKKQFRTINSVIAGLLLLVGFYGLYDEYYAVLDFCYGFLPIFLVSAGIVSLTYGVMKIR